MVRGMRQATLFVVVILALAGCGQRSTRANAQAPYSSVHELPERLSADGTTIEVGNPDAAVKVHLYEDPRCPYCDEFETEGSGTKLQEETVRGDVVTRYTLASFLDDRLGGNGSKKAVNALRAALEEGKFIEYHNLLYANQPAEEDDGFTDAFLLKLAGKVTGLRGSEFDAAVKGMKYRSFVTASEKAYERAGGTDEPEGPGTPTAVINGKRIPPEYSGILLRSTLFADLLESIRADPESWDDRDF